MLDNKNEIYNGEKPIISSDNEYVTYGLYPQDGVLDDELINSLNNNAKKLENGWYIYEGKYYVKVEKAWFICEPIKWKILNVVDDVALVVSLYLLDTCIFNDRYEGLKDGHYANDYNYSIIRKWINDVFYKYAFFLNDGYIITNIIDNSSKTMSNPDYEYKIENTNDKIFLLSHKEFYDYVRNTEIEKGEVSRYAMFNGAWEEDYGDYWLRSPDCYYSHKAEFIGEGGYTSFNPVDVDGYSVRPAIYIKLK